MQASPSQAKTSPTPPRSPPSRLPLSS
jgi:hypothetical protein